MKIFIYKTFFISVIFIIIFEILIGSRINHYEEKIYNLTTKKNIEKAKEKFFLELKNSTKKENYFSEEEKMILINFIKKIKNELDLK